MPSSPNWEIRYVSKGQRVMKNQELMAELEKSVDDKSEKDRLMESFLGYIICCTQVACSFYSLLQIPLAFGSKQSRFNL